MKFLGSLQSFLTLVGAGVLLGFAVATYASLAAAKAFAVGYGLFVADILLIAWLFRHLFAVVIAQGSRKTPPRYLFGLLSKLIGVVVVLYWAIVTAQLSVPFFALGILSAGIVITLFGVGFHLLQRRKLVFAAR